MLGIKHMAKFKIFDGEMPKPMSAEEQKKKAAEAEDEARRAFQEAHGGAKKDEEYEEFDKFEVGLKKDLEETVEAIEVRKRP